MVFKTFANESMESQSRTSSCTTFIISCITFNSHSKRSYNFPTQNLNAEVQYRASTLMRRYLEFTEANSNNTCVKVVMVRW